MPDTLTGWGVRDPEGDLMPLWPQPNEHSAWEEARERLIDWEPGDEGCEQGAALARDFRLTVDDRTAGFRALGYRVLRVELREVTS